MRTGRVVPLTSFLLLLAISVGVQPAALSVDLDSLAGGDTSAVQHADAAAAPRIAGAARLREAGLTGKTAEVFAAATGVSTNEHLEVSVEAAAARRAMVGRVPSKMGDAIGGLLDATFAADATVRTALSTRVRAEASALMADLASGRLEKDMVAADGSIRSSARLESIAQRAHVDDMKTASGAILRAVDRLRAVNAVLPEPGSSVEAVAQCDVLDLAPVLCIAGESANTHISDYNVSIDLGGDDVYRNNEGAGTCVEAFSLQPCLRPVAVLVDLAGNDRYEPRPLPPGGVETDQRVRVQQGSGMFGIGILVDGAGDDTYTTVGPVEPCVADLCSISTVQGTGYIGVGVLSDLGGSDTYRALAPTIETDRLLQLQVYAQGLAIAGAGVLWDAGVGDDIYEIKGSATGTLQFIERRNGADIFSGPGPSSYKGQGSDLAGPALVLDGGGNDRFAVTVTAPADAASSSRSPQGAGGAVVNNWLQGFSVGHANTFGVEREDRFGGIVTGVGNTEYVIDIAARFGVDITGQGYGRKGFIDDAGGDDLYSMRSSVTGEWRTTCDCAAATMDIRGNPIPGANFLDSQRLTGQAAEIGLLHDAGGNDRYIAEIEGDFTLRAHNDNPAGTANISAWLFGVGSACAQACEGMLLDDDGDDTYLMNAEHVVRAERDVAGSVGPGSAFVFLGSSELRGQATSFEGSPPPSALIDRGGLDRYTATRHAAVIGADATRSDPGESKVSVQGGFVGSLIDLDQGEPDFFYAETSTAVDPCVGTHGQAPGWVSRQFDFRGNPAGGDASMCRPAPGVAIVNSTAIAVAGTLTVIDVSSAAGSWPAVVARARLLDGAGTPIVGQPITFLRQSPGSGRWITDAQGWAKSVTDENGVATAIVSFASSPSGALAAGARIRAFFFGTPGAHLPASDVL